MMNLSIMKQKTTANGIFLKKKSIVLIGICSLVLILLCACGSGAQEPTLNTEPAETVEKPDTKKRESVETEESDQTEKNEEAEKGIFLRDVTWEDFEDGMSEPILHFSFSNGTIVDWELQYMSIVKSVTYQDITKDGVDEVIVSREFVNNIHDDYILMDFFKIEEDTIIEISPSTDIPELSDTPWDTKAASSSIEGCSISLTMESCEKIAGVIYTDTIMTVGYDGEGWRVIEQQKIPDWKFAYLDYVISNADAAMDENWLFWLAYVDEDEIPELFFYANDAQFIVSFLTYENGEVKELGDFGGQGAALWYQEKRGNLLCFGAMMGNSSLTAYRLQDGKVEEVNYAATNIPPDMDKSRAEWYWGEETISEDEYEKRSEAVISQMTNRIEYENGMRFYELNDILGSIEE